MRINPVDWGLYIVMRLLKAFDRRETDLMRLERDKIQNILVISSTAIGDTLLSTPAIKALRQCFSNARIVALLNSDYIELFENNPHIDRIIPYYGGYRFFFNTAAELNKCGIDLAVILHGNEPQATPMAYLSGARYIVKLPDAGRFSFLLSNAGREVDEGEIKHGIEYRLDAVSIFGCDSFDKRMVLPVEKGGTDDARRFLQQEGIDKDDLIIGFQVGASTISRMWFADRFIELGKRLVASRANIRIVITGSPSESAYCAGIGNAIGKNAVVSAGKLPLKLIPAIISQFNVLVTGDTGIMHVAVAVGTPVVALYAVADYRRTGPYHDMERHRVIQKTRTCVPCVSKKCEYQKCMENISVDEVYGAVMDIIRAQRGDL